MREVQRYLNALRRMMIRIPGTPSANYSAIFISETGEPAKAVACLNDFRRSAKSGAERGSS
jgi:hypothetical protein